MLYTRTGDTGTSGLFGTKERFPKESVLYEALGTVDELNCLLGLCRAYLARERGAIDVPHALRQVQERLFVIQAELAGSGRALSSEAVREAETLIAAAEERIAPIHSFIVPGATPTAAWLDYARAVARRAERAVLRAAPERAASVAARTYLNRLSSLLYALARYAGEEAREEAPAYTLSEPV